MELTLISFNMKKVTCHPLVCTGWTGGCCKHEEEAPNSIHSSPHKLDCSIAMYLGRIQPLLMTEAESVWDWDVLGIPGNDHQLDKAKVRIQIHVVLEHWAKHSIAS